jgi:hypothetical protein
MRRSGPPGESTIYGTKGDNGRGITCLRAVLVFGNLVFCLLSITIVAVGIYLIVEKIYFVEWVYGTQLAAASCYLIIAAGCIMFIISFIGCFGTLFENKRLLLIYCFVLLLIFLLAVIGAVIAIVFRVWATSMIKVYMRESLLSHYGTNMQNTFNNMVTRCWDVTQEKFQCCAIDDQSWALYRQTFWYKDLPGLQEVDKPYVPFSCCKLVGGVYVDLFTCQMSLDGPPGKQSGVANNAMHYRGCFEAVKWALYPIMYYFIAIGFILAGLVVIGIVCSLILYSRL